MEKLAYPMTVAAGALALDQIMPGWFKRIDVSTLDMGMCDKCIIGQLNNGDSFLFSSLLRNFFVTDCVNIYSDGAFGHEASRDEWIGEINKRLNPPKPTELFRGPQLRVRVLRRHYNKAKACRKNSFDCAVNYCDSRNCPIAQAVKELFPGLKISVAPSDIKIGDNYYYLVGGGAANVQADKPFTCTIVKR